MIDQKRFTCDGYSCVVLNDSTVEIKGYSGMDTALVIPRSLEGRSVTRIGVNAFSNGKLTSVVVPDGVSCIDHDAFQNCAALERVSLPGSAIYVGFGAFMDCAALKLVEFREDGRSPSELEGSAFCGCSNLREIQLPKGLWRIGKRAFKRCARLTSIVLPAALERVETGAFFECERLTRVECRSSAIQLEDYAFWGCVSLKSVSLPDDCALGKHVFGNVKPIETHSSALTAYLASQEEVKSGPRLLIPRHSDYVWEVYGLGDYAPPCYLELACYEDEVRMAGRDEFFHFDIGNLEAVEWYEEDEFRSEADRTCYLAQAARLKAGEIEYFVSHLFYDPPMAEDHYRFLGRPLPNGQTLFDTRNGAGISPWYVYVFVREERPLTPGVLAEWFERLSPALFGDHRSYRIPEDILSREKAERSFRERA